MIIFKCKMCGGDLHPEENATTCECEYCGSVQTIPTADNDKKGNLFNRANRLRMAAEYDKAGAVYASITAEFPEEAEAYWGLCLCKYGIEYVEDPATAKKIPTCHRTRSESIMDDPDFEQACENADAIAKRVYREEAKAIDRLQQDILSVVANESPYDVFICYKETYDSGERTEDSVLAQDIYDALTAKGLKVFFARITLEDKLGQQYEPYIYAALHSAKVMLAVGTQYEYFDAVWVKNEWARFLDMMKSDKTKTLIPCYKDIDAYDMPREFKNLQAQDMGKLGWLQDLTRGVMKLCGKDKESLKETPVIQQVVQTGNPTVDSLLDRAFVFLEDGEWDNASSYADKVLDIDVRNGRAYLVKLMAVLNVRNAMALKDQDKPFDGSDDYKKIIRFGDDSLKAQMLEHNKTINARILEQAVGMLEKASTVDEVNKAKEWGKNITDCDSAEGFLSACEQKANEIIAVDRKKHAIYQEITRLKTQFSESIKKEKEEEKRNQGELNTLKNRFQHTRVKIQELETQINKPALVKWLTHYGSEIEAMKQEYAQCIKERDNLRKRIEELEKVIDSKKKDNSNYHDERDLQYDIAMVYYNNESFVDAKREFMKIIDYKDVSQILEDEHFKENH